MACVGDTCSINATIDPVTGELTNDVILAANSGLECDAGLKVVRYGDSAPVSPTDLCHNQIGITTDNQLFAATQATMIYRVTGAQTVSIPTAGNSSNFSICYEYTNTSDCVELAEVHCGEAKTVFEVNDALEYYLTGNPVMRSNLQNIHGDTSVPARTDYAGDSSAANTELQYSHHIQTAFMLDPNDNLQIGVRFATGTRSGNIVGVANGGVGGNTGFTALRNYLIIHKLGTQGSNIVGSGAVATCHDII